MWPAAITAPIPPPPTTNRLVYVTFRCPGCGVESEWLARFEEITGQTRYVPGDCLCGSVVLVA